MKNLYNDKFNEDYYERGLETGVSCYSNFRWIPELTIPMCATMIESLGIGKFETILDFGSAKGYVVKALRLLHREAYGVEVSEYAIKATPESIRPYIFHYEKDREKLLNMRFDWILTKDVLEHIEYDELDSVLSFMNTVGTKVFAVVPLGEDGKYVIPSYELDTTHIIREPLDWWVAKFKQNDFQVINATYHMAHIKENWEKWGRGNGFFVLKNKSS